MTEFPGSRHVLEPDCERCPALADRSLDSFLDCVLDPIDPAEIEPAILPILHPSY